MDKIKTQKAHAFVVASIRLLTDSFRIIEADGQPEEIEAMMKAIDQLIRVKNLIGRRIR